jgi:uncharacterized protein YwqG
MSLRDDLLSEFSNGGLSPISTELAKLSKECIRMRSAPRANKTISTGTSKLGGLPDLPPGLAWPKWKTGYLTFVAQVNLAELPGSELLPNVGMLSFFYDPDQSAWGFDPKHKEGFRLWYFPEVSQLIRTAESEPATFPCAQLSFEPFLSLPDPSAKSARDLLLERKDREQYRNFLGKRAGPAPQHQVHGWPRIIQDEMELECQLVTNGLYLGDLSGYEDPRRKELEPGADDWTLLFQIDSDDNAQMMWGDGGMLYVWIRRQDLAAQNFEKAWTILQCF